MAELNGKYVNEENHQKVKGTVLKFGTWFIVFGAIALAIGGYVAFKELDDRIEGLIEARNRYKFELENIEIKEPDLEEIMVYMERRDGHESFTL